MLGHCFKQKLKENILIKMNLLCTDTNTISDSLDTNKYFGCKLKGLPIGIPFKSKFFIPKRKKCLFTMDICTFIIAPVSIPESTSTDQPSDLATDALNDNKNNDDESSIEVKHELFKSDEENYQQIDCTFDSGALSDQQVDSRFESSESVKKEPEELEVTPDETQTKKRHASDHSNDSRPTKRIKMKTIEDELQDDGHKQSRRSSRVKDLGYRPDYFAMEAEYDSDNTIDQDNVDCITIKKEIKSEDESGGKVETDEGNKEIEHCHQINNKIKKTKQSDKSAKRDSDSDFSLPDDDLDEENHSKRKCPQQCKNKKANHQRQSAKSDSDSEFSLPDDANIDEENHSEEEHHHRIKNKKKDTKQKSRPTKRDSNPDFSLPDDAKLDNENHKVKLLNINLADHTDKYREEILPSYARKDRGKAIEDVSTKLLTCTMCEKFKTDDFIVLENHIGEHIRGELNCDQCDFIASYKYELGKHGREAHKKNVRLCPVCGKGISSGTFGMKNHLGSEHDSPQWQCSHCRKEGNLNIKFITSAVLRKHVEKDHPETLEQCNNCMRQFFNKYHLQKHIETGCQGDIPEKSYPCEKCGKLFTTSNSVNQHIEHVHNKVRKRQCPHCPYATSLAARLRDHILTHSGKHPFRCDQCSFSCVQRYQLTSHMRTHNGEKPYKCTKCKYAAAWKVQLKEHEKVHSLGNTITCVKCDIVFKDKRGLKIHEKKEHPAEETV